MAALMRRILRNARAMALTASTPVPGADTAPCSIDAARDTQTCPLPDGRVLGYAEFGQADGEPVFFFHGFPSSRLEAVHADKVARRLGLRLLSLERPGYGVSSPQPHRRITDYPDDVLAVARHLGLGRFGIVGGSGGAPYALACAHALPSTMLTGVGLLAGAAPFPGGLSDLGADKHVIPLRSRVLGRWAEWSPGSLKVVFTAVLAGLRWFLDTRWGSQWLDSMLLALEETAKKLRAEKRKERREAALQTQGEGQTQQTAVATGAQTDGEGNTKKRGPVVDDDKLDQEAIEDEEDAADPRPVEQRRKDLIKVILESFRQGADATVQEAYLLSHDWGFRFSDITYAPLYAWHGDKDANVPLEWVQPMFAQLPTVQVKVYKDRTHYDVAFDLKDMLRVFAK